MVNKHHVTGSRTDSAPRNRFVVTVTCSCGSTVKGTAKSVSRAGYNARLLYDRHVAPLGRSRNRLGL